MFGTEIEIYSLAHLLSTPVLVCVIGSASGVHDNITQKSIYIRHTLLVDRILITLIPKKDCFC